MSSSKDQAKKLTVNLYTPHPGQMLLHENTARFRVMCCGRRFGKTLACTNELSKKALQRNASLNWWIAPTYRQTEIAFNLLSDALRPVMKKAPNLTKMRIDLINDSVIECRSAERYDNLRGDGPSFAVFDEASKVPEEAWTEAVRPALADNQGGAIFISTPWGRDWFYHLFQRGQSGDPEWWSKSFPTSANPFIPAAEIEEARRTLPKHVFEQEFLAIFLDDGASVFRHVDSCIGGEFTEPIMGHEYVIGWDVAKYTDYSVVTVIDCRSGQVVFFNRFNRIDYVHQIDTIVRPLAKKYNDALVVMDCTGVGDPVLEQVRERDIAVEGIYFTNTRKRQIVDNCVVAIEQRQVHYPNIPVLINELKAYAYEITKSGNITYNAPSGQHDDCVISLCLATYGAKRGGMFPFAMTAKSPIVVVEEPKIIQLDDAWLMARQVNMAKSLSMLGAQSNFQKVHIKDDSNWGIA